MREHMRNADRTLSNIEAMPEGFNTLRRIYENVQARPGGQARGAGGWRQRGRGGSGAGAVQYKGQDFHLYIILGWGC